MIYRFSGIEVDEDRDEVRRGGELVRAQKKVRDLLVYLIRRRERLVSKEELFGALWPGVVVNEGALSQALYAARRAVGDDARRPRVLQTVRGRGVRFVAEVEALEPPPADAAAGPSAHPPAPPFVGRDALLEELGRALRAASAGEGGVFLMAGEPGIGKTRAAEEFAAVAVRRGAAVHVGRCHEAPGAPAFWPWVQLLRSLAQAHAPEALGTLLGSGANDIAQIAPEVVPTRERAREGTRRREALQDPGPARFRLFDAVTQLWQRVAEQRTLVLVLDDLHRADPPSWRLLHFLARELRGAGILVVGTYRDADAHREDETAELLAELARQPGVRSAQLAGLDREAVAVLLRAATEREPERPVVDALLERTNGNPFFVTHLASLLARDEEEAEEGSLDPSRVVLPPTLRDAVAAQLEGLPERSRALLRTASVIGRSFPLGVLEAAAATPRPEVLDALDFAASAGLVQRDGDRLGQFQFTHILVRDALYEMIPTRDRAGAHARVGEALERMHRDDLEPHLEQLAHHFSAAALLGDAERALDYSRRAGARARERLAFEEAARHFAHALELLGETEDATEEVRCQLLLDLGEAQTRAGQREEARENFSRAAALAAKIGASDKLAHVALASAPGLVSIESGVYDPFTVSLLESALEFLPSRAPGLRAQTLSRLAMALYWSNEDERRRQLVSQAEECADTSEEPAAVAYSLAARYAALWDADTLEDRERIAGQMIKSADASDDQSICFLTRVFHITTLLEKGDFSGYFESVRDFCRLAHSCRDPHGEWYARLFDANRALMKGEVDASLELAGEFHEMGNRLDDVNADQAFAGYIATAAVARGNVANLSRIAEEQAARHQVLDLWRCASALLFALEGEHGRAKDVVATFCSKEGLRIRKDMNAIFCMGMLAFAVGIVGIKDNAELLYSELTRYRDRHLVAGYGSLYWGSVLRPLAVVAKVLGRDQEATKLKSELASVEGSGGVSLWWCDRVAERV